jgi:hypothetical protein
MDRSVWQLLGVEKIKMAAVAMVTKIQNGHQIQKSSYLGDSPFFVSMATAAKFVQSIPIFLAYLVPLDVDVVPI